MMKKLVLGLTISILAFGLMLGSVQNVEAETYKAAMLLSGPINDGGWNTSAYNGLKRLEEEFGFEIAFTENVKKAEQESILRKYAQSDYDIIYGHGFEFGDAMKEVAEDFPETNFFNIGGNVEAKPNLASGRFVVSELGYLTGKLAALFTKTDKIGFVGAQEIPTIKGEVDTIIDTVELYNPDAEVTVAYTGSFTAIDKGKEAALAQISNGVDVLIGIGNACNVGAIKAAKANEDVYVIGWAGDFHDMAPKTVLTSGVQSVPRLVELAARNTMEGTFEAEAKKYGSRKDAQFFGEWSDVVSEDLKKNLEADWKAINQGLIDVKEYY